MSIAHTNVEFKSAATDSNMSKNNNASKPFNVAQIQFPVNADELLSSIKQYNYHQRIPYVCALANKYRETHLPQLKLLIQQLQSINNTSKLVITIEEDDNKEDSKSNAISELFPSSDVNVKHYAEYQLALYMISTLKLTDLLLKELNSCNKYFKDLAVSSCLRDKNLLSDEIVQELIVKSTPVIRRKLIGGCIRFHRPKVLDALFPVILEQYGVNEAARFLHACTKEIVEKYLPQIEFLQSKEIHWSKLVVQHGLVVLDIMSKELVKAFDPKTNFTTLSTTIRSIWATWEERLSAGDAWDELIYRGGYSERLLKLGIEYGEVQSTPTNLQMTNAYYIDSKVPLSDSLIATRQLKTKHRLSITLPNVITSRLAHFLKKHPATMHAFFRSSFCKYGTNECWHAIPESFWELKCPAEYNLQLVRELIDDMFQSMPSYSLTMWAINKFLPFTDNIPSERKYYVAYILNWYKTNFPRLNDRSEVHFNAVHSYHSYVTKVHQHITQQNMSLENEIAQSHYFHRKGWSAKNLNKVPTPETVLRINENQLKHNCSVLNILYEHTSDIWINHFFKIKFNKESDRLTMKEICLNYYQGFLTNYEEHNTKPQYDLSGLVNIISSQIIPVLFAEKIQVPDDTSSGYHRSSDPTEQYTKRLLLFSNTFLRFVHAKLVNFKGNQSIVEKNRLIIHSNFQLFYDLFRPYHLMWARNFVEWMKYLEKDDCILIFKSFEMVEFKSLANHQLGIFMDLCEIISRLDLSLLQPVLQYLFADDNIPVETRDQLLQFQYIDNQVWKDLSKLTDSANIQQRSEAYKALISATIRLKSLPQLQKTLQLIMKKIKNESALNRADCLMNLFGKMNCDDTIDKKISLDRMAKRANEAADNAFLLNPAVLPIYMELLQDCLEVQDLDKFNDDIGTLTSRRNTNYSMSFEFLEVYEQNLNFTSPTTDTLDNIDKPKPSEKPKWDKPKFDQLTKQHFILGYFYELSINALRLSASGSSQSAALLKFAFEIQWKISLFRLGEKYCALYFRLNPGVHLVNYRLPRVDMYAPSSINIAVKPDLEKGHENEFIHSLINEYDHYLSDRNPDWLKPRSAPSYLESFFRMVGTAWNTVDVLVEQTKILLKEIQAQPKDSNGLLIVNKNHSSVSIFQYLLDLQGQNWYEYPVLMDYVNTMLRSRLARLVLWRWFAFKRKTLQSGSQTNAALKQQRNSIVNELLSITSSAIYLNFVKNHLARWNQQALEAFINGRNPFFGPFYLAPHERVKMPLKPSQKAAQSPEKKPAKGRKSLRRRGRGGARVVSFVPKFQLHARTVWWESLTSESMYDDIKEEIKTLATMEVEKIEFGRNDFAEYYELPVYYGLLRFLPHQTEQMGVALLYKSLNPDRSIPERVKALAKWTLLPTTTAAEMAYFYENPAKFQIAATLVYPDKQPQLLPAIAPLSPASGKTKKAEKFPVNLSECLLKGIMHDNNNFTGLRYLLQSKFLSSQSARVAVFSIRSVLNWCIPYVFTKLMRYTLSGKRRTAMKVTAYKEIVRLVAQNNTSANRAILLHEWNRTELHRDVRICLIQIAIAFLHGAEGKGVKEAWEILESAVRIDSKELLASLLGAQPQESKVSVSNPAALAASGLVQDVKLESFLDNMRKCKVPREYCARYAENIIHKLTFPDIDDDVRNIAIMRLHQWIEFGKLNQLAAETWAKQCIINQPKYLNDPRPKTQTVFDNRFALFSQLLINITGIITTPLYVDPAFHVERKYLQSVFDTFADYVIDTEDTTLRCKLFSRLENLLNLLPNQESVSLDNPIIAKTVKLRQGELFWNWTIRQIQTGIPAYLYSDENERIFLNRTITFLNLGLEHCLKRNNVMDTEYFLNELRTLINRLYFPSGNKGTLTKLPQLLIQRIISLHRNDGDSQELLQKAQKEIQEKQCEAETPIFQHSDEKGDFGTKSIILSNMLIGVTLSCLQKLPHYSADYPASFLWFFNHVLVSSAKSHFQKSMNSTITADMANLYTLDWVHNSYSVLSINMYGFNYPQPKELLLDLSNLFLAILPASERAYYRGYRYLNHVCKSLIEHLAKIALDQEDKIVLDIMGKTSNSNSRQVYRSLAQQLLLHFSLAYPTLLIDALKQRTTIKSLMICWIKSCIDSQVFINNETRINKDQVTEAIQNILNGYSILATNPSEESVSMAISKQRVLTAVASEDVKFFIQEIMENRLISYNGSNNDLDSILKDKSSNSGSLISFNFELAFQIFERYPYYFFKQTNQDVKDSYLGYSFVLECVVRSVLFPQLSQQIRKRLVETLALGLEIRSFQTEFTPQQKVVANKTVLVPLDPNNLELAKSNKPIWNDFYWLINALIHNQKATIDPYYKHSFHPHIVSNSMAGNLLQAPAGHNFSGLLGLDLIKIFGNATKVMIEETKEEKERKQETKKEEKKEEKIFSPTLTVWRKEFIDLLKLFDNDKDTGLYKEARFYQTTYPIVGVTQSAVTQVVPTSSSSKKLSETELWLVERIKAAVNSLVTYINAYI